MRDSDVMHRTRPLVSRRTRRFWPWVANVLFKSIVLLTALNSPASASVSAASQSPDLSLLQLSLEDLGQIKVTTVSRKSENLSSAAAAIHVITQDDIRRSGVNSIPEALRLAPGLEVAQANARQWAITARGFNDTFANKLLVLMDGRTLYTPLFSGVFWEETDTVLEDIDRIEVIRGPGATLWGANAVNGVINIITKSARETQGGLISGGGGLEERAFGSVRYGGKLGSNAWYRVYGKYGNHDESTLTDGGEGVGDDWWMTQGGFRVDWEPPGPNRLTLQSDYHYGDLAGKFFLHSPETPVLVPANRRFTAEGADALARWTHEFSSASEMSVQMSYDRMDHGIGIGNELRDTFDLDTQHRFHFGERHEIIWGGGYRLSTDRITETADLRTSDPEVGIQLFSGFVQDELAVVPERLHLTVGTKVEHNDFTGFEVQPSGRIAWTPHERHTVWGAVSRAVRTPSRSERDFTIFVDPATVLAGLPLPTLVSIDGNSEFGSEELVAYEVGYRVQLHPRLSLDCAAFYNDYDHLRAITGRTLEFQLSPRPHLIVPAAISNDVYGQTYGGEVAVAWQPLDSLRLRANYTFLHLALHTRGVVPSITETLDEGATPQHQVFLGSDVDLGRNVEWGMGARFIEAMPQQTVGTYFGLESRLAWKPTAKLELAIVGRNLLDPHHREFAPSLLTYRRVEVDRSVFAKLTVRF